VQFSIPQVPDNPDGTQIKNSAAIFFDFNAPVLTNQTLHTVGSHFIIVSTDDPAQGQSAIQVYPNPAVDIVNFKLTESSGQQFAFELVDILGRPVRQMKNIALPLALDCSELPAGSYFLTKGEHNDTL